MKGLSPLKPLSGRIVNNIIGNKRFGGKNDLDGDGVINKKDCQPRNTMRQDKVAIMQALQGPYDNYHSESQWEDFVKDYAKDMELNTGKKSSRREVLSQISKDFKQRKF